MRYKGRLIRMVKKTIILSIRKDTVSMNVVALTVLGLWSTNAFADLAAFQQCTGPTVTGILGIVTIITIVSLFFEHILGEVIFGMRVPYLRLIVNAIGRKLVPWVGAIFILIELVPLLGNCVPRL
jgi:hypothetical protein